MLHATRLFVSLLFLLIFLSLSRYCSSLSQDNCLINSNLLQNHLINSTLPIFNLLTQPLFSSQGKGHLLSKRVDKKRTPNSLKRFVFKPFSIFNSVHLTSILPSPHVPYSGTYLQEPLSGPCSPSSGRAADHAPEYPVHRTHRQL